MSTSIRVIVMTFVVALLVGVHAPDTVGLSAAPGRLVIIQAVPKAALDVTVDGQSVSQAVYDDQGTLMSCTFVDYLLPTAADTISFDIDHTTSPSTTNTLGTKGVGEAGTIASTPAVVNAVVDAVRHLGVNDIVMPCTPERVWRAINTSGSGGSTTAAAMPHFDESESGTASTEGAGA